MERILTGIDTQRPSLDALIRALCLGPRIQAKVTVLVVFPPGRPGPADKTAAFMRQVESEIESAKTAGANVELFVAEGRFEQELLSAARRLKTTLLVASGTDDQGGEREAERLRRILSAVDCRVELVSARKNLETEKGRT